MRDQNPYVCMLELLCTQIKMKITHRSKNHRIGFSNNKNEKKNALCHQQWFWILCIKCDKCTCDREKETNEMKTMVRISRVLILLLKMHFALGRYGHLIDWHNTFMWLRLHQERLIHLPTRWIEYAAGVE